MKKKNEQLEKRLNKEKNIKAEYGRLKKLYKNFPKEKQKAIEGLLQNSAFLKITLDETMNDLLENDMFEIFEQGSQRFERERPQSKTYSVYIQKYAAVQKQLIDLLPVEGKKKEQDELMSFINKSKDLKK